MHPRTKLNFDLDQEERAIVAKADQMSREEVWECLEKKRYDDLKRKALVLAGECMANARCPICTLPPPCNHFHSNDEIVSNARKIMATDDFKKAIP